MKVKLIFVYPLKHRTYTQQILFQKFTILKLDVKVLSQNFSLRKSLLISRVTVMTFISFLVPIFSASHILLSQISPLKTQSDLILENKRGHH